VSLGLLLGLLLPKSFSLEARSFYS